MISIFLVAHPLILFLVDLIIPLVIELVVVPLSYIVIYRDRIVVHIVAPATLKWQA